MKYSSRSVVSKEQGATAVITHRVSADKHGEYERWVDEIVPQCKAYPGHMDWHMIRPIPGVSDLYTIIIRFDTEAHLRAWMDSPVRARLIEKAQPLLVTGDDFYISSGLDFWFMPAGARAKTPVRWKQFLLTWSAVYPLVLLVPLAVVPLLRFLGIPQYHFLDMLVITGIMVCLMVYAIMPHYTRLVHRWLFD